LKLKLKLFFCFGFLLFVLSPVGLIFVILSHDSDPEQPVVIEREPAAEIPSWFALDISAPSIFEAGKRRDIILESYRDPVLRDGVVEFFTTVANSRVVAAIILGEAAASDIPPALAFALCWEESRYTVRAVNANNLNGSIDRGLFQLNNLSFPQLKEADFFNPETNARYGMSHLRWCLDTAGSEIAGLAMYNAGANRVQSNTTPKRTLDYVSRILDLRNRIEEAFRVGYLFKEGLPESPELAVPVDKRAELVQIALFPYRKGQR
jgi:hypothetical protein